jgi:hypothetical protein
MGFPSAATDAYPVGRESHMRSVIRYLAVIGLAAAAALLLNGYGGTVLSDQAAIRAAGVQQCVQRPNVLVGAEYQCAGGLTLRTFPTAAMRSHLASGLPVVRQGTNWMVTAEN